MGGGQRPEGTPEGGAHSTQEALGSDSMPESSELLLSREVAIGDVRVGGRSPLGVIAGPCVIEDETSTLRTAERIARITRRLGLPLIFKSSFDKANRTSPASFRGPGLEEGLRILAKVRIELGIPVTTDVHLPNQARAVAECVDLLQVPAFLCRQTDLLTACGATGRVVNVKKGQFLSPWDMEGAVRKLEQAGAGGILLTERGTSFGYRNLVVDLRSLQVMRRHGWPVVFDGTHSVQLPGAGGLESGGQRAFIPLLMRGAVAAGIDVLFLEVHENPQSALCDASNMVPLAALETMLERARALHELIWSR